MFYEVSLPACPLFCGSRRVVRRVTFTMVNFGGLAFGEAEVISICRTARLCQPRWATVEQELKKRQTQDFEDGIAADAASDTCAYLHQAKIGPRLLRELKERHMATGLVTMPVLESSPDTERWGDYVELSPLVAHLYMICLGAVMASTLNVPLVSDERFREPLQYASFGTIPFETPRRLALMMRLGLPFPEAKSLAHLSVAEVVQFSEKYRDEKRRFRNVLESVAADVSQVESKAALQDLLADQKAEIEDALSDYRRVLDENRVKSVSSALTLSVPSTLVVAAGAAAVTPLAPAVPVILVGGLAVAGVAWWADHRSRTTKAIKDCPWHYALRLAKLRSKART